MPSTRRPAAASPDPVSTRTPSGGQVTAVSVGTGPVGALGDELARPTVLETPSPASTVPLLPGCAHPPSSTPNAAATAQNRTRSVITGPSCPPHANPAGLPLEDTALWTAATR